MRDLVWILGAVMVAVAAGCLERRPTVAPGIGQLAAPSLAAAAELPPPAGGGAPSSPAPANVPPHVAAAQERIKPVLDRLLANSPGLGLKPAVLVTDQQDFYIGRREFERIFISAGAVQRCATEGQLAAILSRQLGELYAERRAEISAMKAARLREPPPTVNMVRENGMYGNPDQIHMAEIVTLGLDKRQAPVEPPVDAQRMAAEILVRAGYSERELTAAATQSGPAR